MLRELAILQRKRLYPKVTERVHGSSEVDRVGEEGERKGKSCDVVRASTGRLFRGKRKRGGGRVAVGRGYAYLDSTVCHAETMQP